MTFKPKKLPKHLAIIMDGNGRWAKRRGFPRNYGHKVGIFAVERTIEYCLKYGIKYLTLFAFSTENWKRNKEEIDGIFQLIRNYISENRDRFVYDSVKINYIGTLNPFPNDLVSILEDARRKTEKCDKLTITLALNYGGRDEILRAINKIIRDGRKEITSEIFESYLDTKNIPNPDMIVRTSGEYRISNFLLYQMAYSEFYFTKTYWPDFNERAFVKVLKAYQKRDRRYGGTR